MQGILLLKSKGGSPYLRFWVIKVVLFYEFQVLYEVNRYVKRFKKDFGIGRQ